MGLFDSFIPAEPIKCPFCGESTLGEFQTKCLECLMHSFREGDSINKGDEYLTITDGRIPVYDSCESCKSWVTAYAEIHENHFIGLTDVGGEGSRKKEGK